MERFTPNEDTDSLAEFLESQRESIQHTLTELLAEQHGLKVWVGVDVQYRHMFQERVVNGHLNTHSRAA